MTAFRVGMATDTGRVRTNNQDSNLVGSELFAVADGMGGHQAGEVASALAVETIQAHATTPTIDALRDSVQLANRVIFEKAGSDEALRGMGTTLCALRLIDTPEGQLVAWANVGDSRIYLFRDSSLIQLSEDHSLVQGLVRDGQLTKDAAAVHPQRNIVTRALGIDIDVDVDVDTVVPYRGDRYLLCSDGLVDEVAENLIAGALRRLVDPNEASAELVRLANEHGGRDNITVVIVEVTDDGGRAESASMALADDPTSPVLIPPSPPVQGPHEDDDDAFVNRRSLLPDADDEKFPPSEERSGEFFDDLDKAQTRHWTWRVGAFVLIMALVLVAAVGAVGWYARRTYFVGFRDGEVTILKGRPDGLLWFDPTVEQRMGVKRTAVPQASRDEIDKGKDQSSVGAARRYVANLQDQIAKSRPTAATTTRPRSVTTTTTKKATRTTRRSGPRSTTTATSTTKP